EPSCGASGPVALMVSLSNHEPVEPEDSAQGESAKAPCDKGCRSFSSRHPEPRVLSLSKRQAVEGHGRLAPTVVSLSSGRREAIEAPLLLQPHPEPVEG